MRSPILIVGMIFIGATGCGTLANTGPDRHSTQTDAERATPTTRTSDDELDGPTAPRGSMYRPPDEEATE